MRRAFTATDVRAVLDANVFISAVITPRGPSAALLRAAASGEFEMITCGRLLTEVNRTLRRPRFAGISDDDRAQLIWFLVHGATLRADVPADPGSTRDPDDDYLIPLARDNGASLVTGDRHLLDLPGMPAIMTPRRFLALLA